MITLSLLLVVGMLLIDWRLTLMTFGSIGLMALVMLYLP